MELIILLSYLFRCNLIYLDNNATTLVDPRVAAAIYEAYLRFPSNPSSMHRLGQEGKKSLLRAREAIASYLACLPQEIIFTSGGTESMNLLIQVALATSSRPHVITSSIEHASVYKTLQARGDRIDLTPLSPGLWGAPTVQQIADALRPNTAAIIISAANSETGVKADLEAISHLALQHKVPLIVDGVALLGKEPVRLFPGITGMGFSGHKIHGPQGTGFVFIRKGWRAHPQLIGGDQEYGWRAGTENLPGIIGLGVAVNLLQNELPAATERMGRLKQEFENRLKQELSGITIHGEGPRLVNTSNISFHGMHGEDLLISLDLAGIAASHGSACSSGALEPSRVLINMGISHKMARSAIRFSLSRFTTEEELAACIKCLQANEKQRR